MGLFSKDKKEEREDIPRLPELPRLPDLPELNDMKNLPQLPSFPRNSFGEKFSQNTIKDAVAGLKESDQEADADEFADEDVQMMQKPAKGKFMAMETDENADEEEYRQFQRFERKALETPSFSSGSYKGSEPIFVRLDKFEDSLKIFEKTRNQISEIEDVLREIKRIKEQEEKELQFWEQEIQNIKKQIEKVDKDIFSRIE